MNNQLWHFVWLSCRFWQNRIYSGLLAVFITRKWRSAKVMFLETSVCSRGSVLVSTMPWGRQTSYMQIPLFRQTPCIGRPSPDMVNKWAVRTVLECILVSVNFEGHTSFSFASDAPLAYVICCLCTKITEVIVNYFFYISQLLAVCYQCCQLWILYFYLGFMWMKTILSLF